MPPRPPTPLAPSEKPVFRVSFELDDVDVAMFRRIGLARRGRKIPVTPQNAGIVARQLVRQWLAQEYAKTE